MGDSAPLHEKARAEQMIADARAALKEEVALARLRSLASDLEQMVHSLGVASSQPTGATTGRGARQAGGAADDVVDVEYTEKLRR